jgi:pyruvate dehydrogenase E1 component alpha subunit
MRGQDRVVIALRGRRHKRGDWHEGTNMAAVFKSPVVYLCNNNQYAYSTPLER